MIAPHCEFYSGILVCSNVSFWQLWGKLFYFIYYIFCCTCLLFILANIGISIIDITRSDDRLRFIMGIPIPISQWLFNELRYWGPGIIRNDYRQVSNMIRIIRQLNCWSLICSWSIACRHCSNYIFILDLAPGFNILHKDKCKLRREVFKISEFVRLILEILR